MKYLRLFESFEDIDKICKKFGIENYTINSDGSIDVDAPVDLYELGLTKLPIKFNKVNGDFYCSYNKLTTLEGSPIEVNGYFGCHNNQLTTLKGSPKEVNGDFKCVENQLTSFEFAPKIIRGDFDCRYNRHFENKNMYEYIFKIILK